MAREYPKLGGLSPLEALAKYLSGPAVAHHSVCLQVPMHAQAAAQFFDLRKVLGVHGYANEAEALAAIKTALGVLERVMSPSGKGNEDTK